MNGNAEDGGSGGYYGVALHAAHIANNILHGGSHHLGSSQHHLSGGGPLHHPGETDSLSMRLSQPPAAVDLRTASDSLMLNGLVFPLPPALAHLPPPLPPGPSNK